MIAFQLAFIIEKDSSILSDEEILDFLSSLEQLGITLGAYNGAYNNDEHPLVVESMTHYQQSQRKDHPPPKKRKTWMIHQAPAKSNSENPSMLISQLKHC